jgi:hypothetical protein
VIQYSGIISEQLSACSTNTVRQGSCVSLSMWASTVSVTMKTELAASSYC